MSMFGNVIFDVIGKVLLELLQVGGAVQFDEGRLLVLAEKAEL